jgi:formate dehydrogenase
MSERIPTVEATPSKRPHPGKGKRRGRNFNRGRQVQPEALQAIQSLLGTRSRQRDLLIEHLHLIQDHYGHISAAHLAALADEMRIPMAEAYEVATFYAHFDVVKEGESPPPALTIRVCDSLSCQLNGADQLQAALSEGVDTEQVRVVRAPCMGRCDSAPVVEVGHKHIGNADVVHVQNAIAKQDTHPDKIESLSLAQYRQDGGYQLLQACQNGERSYEEISGILNDSGLRGLGGAGFPTATKWKFVKQAEGPRLMAINGDEGEPGTFKDRHYLEQDPHRFLEGMLISAWAVEADAIYIYLRDEYPHIRALLQQEIAAIESAGLVEVGKIHLRRGAGAYICGEESAMIESLEGKRGYPRQRPPYVAQVGLFNRPTLVNNIETVFWLRDIIDKGADWFASHGRNGRQGLRSYSVSGRVNKPGVHLAPAGISLAELIEEFCGGMLPGHTLKAYLPGGASGGILPASMDNVPLDFGTLEEHGCFIGSAAVIVLSDKDDMRAVALNLMKFFADESCGQCTPCRNGTEKAVQIMEAKQWNLPLLEDLSQVMRDASICGLGQAASNPVASVVKHFESEIIASHRGDQ